MSILGTIGYSQTYYYNTVTNTVTAKDSRNADIAACLNGKSKDALDKYDRAEMSAIEAFLKMKGSGMNSIWSKLNAVEGSEGVYEFTYTRKGDSSLIEINDQVIYEDYFTTLPKRDIESMESAMSSPKGKAPYSMMADENGMIEYNGVVFTCDYKNNQLCLGDMSNPDDVIRIPLSEGGCLMLNRDNIGDLSKAIGMFSPEDINLILRALKMDAKVQQMKKEIEEMEDGIGKSSGEINAQDGDDARKAARDKGETNGFTGYEEGMDYIAKKKEEILDKVKRGETEVSVPMGADSFTDTQWNKLIKNVDEAIDDMQESVKREKEEAEEKALEKKENEITEQMLDRLLMDDSSSLY